MAQPISTPPPGEWLALGVASRRLGVDPDTLRRWADEGRITAWTTPGGHRRFARRDLDRLVARRTGPGGALAGVGATPDRISAAVRRGYGGSAAGHIEARTRIPDADREDFRTAGRGLVAALVAHLDADDAPARARAAADADRLTDEFAVRLAAAGVTLPEAVALFVAARRPFLAELAALGRRRTLDPARLAALYESASGLLDRLLVRLVETHAGAAP